MGLAFSIRPFRNRSLCLSGLLSAALVATLAGSAIAQDSNRNQVRAEVESGGWNTAWGVTINEAEYTKAGISLYNGSISAYFGDLVERNIDKIMTNLSSVARTAVQDAVKRAFKNRGQVIRVGRLGVKAGIATYNRWSMVSMQVPDGTERYKIRGPWGTWTYGYRPKWKTIKKKVPLPNHHQPYVAFRLY